MSEDTISRQAAIDALDEYIEEYSYDLDENGYHNPKWCAMQEAKMTIQRLPSAERRGRWERKGYHLHCSCCGWSADLATPHCPGCGAYLGGDV